ARRLVTPAQGEGGAAVAGQRADGVAAQIDELVLAVAGDLQDRALGGYAGGRAVARGQERPREEDLRVAIGAAASQRGDGGALAGGGGRRMGRDRRDEREHGVREVRARDAMEVGVERLQVGGRGGQRGLVLLGPG